MVMFGWCVRTELARKLVRVARNLRIGIESRSQSDCNGAQQLNGAKKTSFGAGIFGTARNFKYGAQIKKLARKPF
ncbi:hypothetical protein ACFQPF_08215 [Fictibacillus iocasae]|uniref:Uncharacterized protein n=1 Tax=Fictibacillus iocasae TaxID=2715437 RepID=A0ABW2NMG8_9BACL